MKRIVGSHLIEHDGYLWCEAGNKQRMLKGGRRRKRCHATIEEAWIASFVAFVGTGNVLTPYRCAPILRWLSVQRIVFHPNPWATKGWLSRVRFAQSKRRRCCGMFHLTRDVKHLLRP